MIRIFLLISLPFFFACSSSKQSIDENRGDCDQFLIPPNQLIKYRTRIFYKDKNITGLVFLKRTAEEGKASMINESGLRIFDMAYVEGAMQSKYMMSVLDKKAIVNTLKYDFAFFFLSPLNYAAKNRNRLRWEFDQSCRIRRIRASGSTIKAMELTVSNYRDDVPDDLNLWHKNMDLRISFKRLE